MVGRALFYPWFLWKQFLVNRASMYLFEVNNRKTRTVEEICHCITSFLCLWTYFLLCSAISIVYLEQGKIINRSFRFKKKFYIVLGWEQKGSAISKRLNLLFLLQLSEQNSGTNFMSQWNIFTRRCIRLC